MKEANSVSSLRRFRPARWLTDEQVEEGAPRRVRDTSPKGMGRPKGVCVDVSTSDTRGPRGARDELKQGKEKFLNQSSNLCCLFLSLVSTAHSIN